MQLADGFKLSSPDFCNAADDAWVNLRLPSSLMFDYPTMKEVANRIVELSIENA